MRRSLVRWAAGIVAGMAGLAVISFVPGCAVALMPFRLAGKMADETAFPSLHASVPFEAGVKGAVTEMELTPPLAKDYWFYLEMYFAPGS